jgi:hypothetical protein
LNFLTVGQNEISKCKEAVAVEFRLDAAGKVARRADKEAKFV